MVQMRATKTEAYDLLAGWMRERRVIADGTSVPSVITWISYGFITELTEEQISIGFDEVAPHRPVQG